MDRQMTPDAKLRELEEWYTENVNLAVAQERYDVVDELALEFEVSRDQLRAAA
jgi:hypothetical protein